MEETAIRREEECAADIAAAVDLVKPAHLPLQIRERQYAGTAVYAGTFPRQGDTMILWKVDCT